MVGTPATAAVGAGPSTAVEPPTARFALAPVEEAQTTSTPVDDQAVPIP
jgi:hypothetical protein